MSWFLYRTGRWSFRHRGVVLSIWLCVLVGLGAGAATLSGPTTDSFSMKGLESTKALDLIEERAPQAAPNGASARIFFRHHKASALTAT